MPDNKDFLIKDAKLLSHLFYLSARNEGDLPIEAIEFGTVYKKLALEKNKALMGRRGSGKTTILHGFKSELAKKQNVAVEMMNSHTLMTSDLAKIKVRILTSLSRFVLDELDRFLEAKISDIYKSEPENSLEVMAFFFRRQFWKNREKIKNFRGLQKSAKELLESLAFIEDIPNRASLKITQEYKQKSTVTTKSGAKLKTEFLNLQTNMSSSFTSELLSKWDVDFDVEKSDLCDDFAHFLRPYIEGSLKYMEKSLFFIIDDFYEIPIEHHPPLLKFLHDFSYGYNLFLIIGTVQERTDFGILTIGQDLTSIKLGWNVDQMIDITKEYTKIFNSFLSQSGLEYKKITDIFEKDVLQLLAIGSGGNTRQFVNLCAITLSLYGDEEVVNKKFVETGFVERAIAESFDSKLEELKGLIGYTSAEKDKAQRWLFDTFADCYFAITHVLGDEAQKYADMCYQAGLINKVSIGNIIVPDLSLLIKLGKPYREFIEACVRLNNPNSHIEIKKINEQIEKQKNLVTNSIE